jgi:hypothetical protein
MGFPSEHIVVNHFYNTLSNYVNLGCFNVRRLKRNFTLSLDAINNRNWHFCFFMSYTADDQMLYEAITTFRLLPLSSLLITVYSRI